MTLISLIASPLFHQIKLKTLNSSHRYAATPQTFKASLDKIRQKTSPKSDLIREKTDLRADQPAKRTLIRPINRPLITLFGSIFRIYRTFNYINLFFRSKSKCSKINKIELYTGSLSTLLKYHHKNLKEDLFKPVNSPKKIN